MFLGYEDEPDARFVQLVECGHVIESQGMESFMRVEGEPEKDMEITAKTCPRCKTPLHITHRYSEHIKATFKDIIKIKAIVFGNPDDNNALRQGLERRVKALQDTMASLSLSKFDFVFYFDWFCPHLFYITF